MATIVIQPDGSGVNDDTYISSELATSNFGGNTSLLLGHELTGAKNDQDQFYYILLRFNLIDGIANNKCAVNSIKFSRISTTNSQCSKVDANGMDRIGSDLEHLQWHK